MNKWTPADPKDRLIFALDVDTVHEALEYVRELSPFVRNFKIGLQLFLGCGWDAVREVVNLSQTPVFLDLKLLDIPPIMEAAFRQINWHSGPGLVRMLTIAPTSMPLKNITLHPSIAVLAVPVLSSINLAAMSKRLPALHLEDCGPLLATHSMESGCQGIVASPNEVEKYRQLLGAEALIVSTGVRPAWAPLYGDESRFGTPSQAIEGGADYVVVGRPIREHADPLSAVSAIQAEIAGACLRLASLKESARGNDVRVV